MTLTYEYLFRRLRQHTDFDPCPWLYKGTECGYSGSSYWDINNNPASSANDVCAKTFNACELRFPESGESPFGGFPGAGINMG